MFSIITKSPLRIALTIGAFYLCYITFGSFLTGLALGAGATWLYHRPDAKKSAS